MFKSQMPGGVARGNMLRANFFVNRVKTEKCGTCLQNQLPSLFAQRYLMASQ